MKSNVPNYPYNPLATSRQLKLTRDAVRGENATSKPFVPRMFNAQKKEILRILVKDKKMSLRFGKPIRTRNNSNPMMNARLATDPMYTSDPTPGNAMHIGNTRAAYLGY